MGDDVRFVLKDKAKFARAMALAAIRIPTDPKQYEAALAAWLASGEVDRSKRPPVKRRISSIKREEFL